MTPSPERSEPTADARVTGQNAFEEALGVLVDRIRSGALPEGSRLPAERTLSEELQVSRNTLRAVIRSLQQAGYVQTSRGRSGGSFVIWRGPEGESEGRLNEQMATRLLDMLKFRSVLEPGAAALAAGKELTKDERAELERLLDRATQDGPGFRIADAELHSYIAQLSECHALADAIANVQLILNETLLQVVPVMGPALKHSHEQHQLIIASILGGEVDGARRAMSEHVGATAALIRSFLASPR